MIQAKTFINVPGMTFLNSFQCGGMPRSAVTNHLQKTLAFLKPRPWTAMATRSGVGRTLQGLEGRVASVAEKRIVLRETGGARCAIRWEAMRTATMSVGHVTLKILSANRSMRLVQLGLDIIIMMNA